MSRDERWLRGASLFLDEHIAKLRKKHYADLQRMMGSELLTVPDDLSVIGCSALQKVQKQQGKRIVVTVSVAKPSSAGVPGVLASALTASFSMSPDGSSVLLDGSSEVAGAKGISRERKSGRSRVKRVGSVRLPSDIDSRVLRYLHLELGEPPGKRGSLTRPDLVYQGEGTVEGVPVVFWEFPSTGGRCWATVQQDGRTYVISMTTRKPLVKRTQTTQTCAN